MTMRHGDSQPSWSESGGCGRVVAAVLIGVALAGWPALAGATIPTPTPTATATPRLQRTGDLGTEEVTGRVYDAQRGIDAGIADATVSYTAPGGSGAVQTDANGAFAFSLFLHDTDLVTVRALAPGFHASEVRIMGVGLWFQTSLDFGLEPVERSTHRIAGVVYRDPYCSDGSTITIDLQPLGSGDQGRSLVLPPFLPPSNEFAFDDVPDGDYQVSARSDCQPSYAAPVLAYVRGADAYVVVSFDMVCPPVVLLDPERGPAGSLVELRGRCYYIHSGRSAEVYLDAERVTTVRGETSGHYRTHIRIPEDARGGWHGVQVSIPGSVAGMLIGTAGFYVDEDVPTPCIGDCNGDHRVGIDELITGVRSALGFRDAVCPAIATTGDGEAAIAELVAAVANALQGCGSWGGRDLGWISGTD